MFLFKGSFFFFGGVIMCIQCKTFVLALGSAMAFSGVITLGGKLAAQW